MFCLSAGRTGRDSPAMALDPCWELALPMHPQHRDEQRERSVSNTGRDVPTRPLAQLGAALANGANGRGCPGSPPCWRGAERNPGGPHLLFLLLPKNPRELRCEGAWPGWAVVGPSPEHPTSYSFLRLITDPPCSYHLLHPTINLAVPLQKEKDGRDSTYHPAGPSPGF